MKLLFRRLLPLILILFYIPMKAQGYTLIWHDEFNISSKPDPEKWSYETGFVRNQEEQIYTSRKKNARIRKGKLEIIALKENYRNRKFDPAGKNYKINTPDANYTSASLHTGGKFEFQYGRVEVRAKLPKGRGVWAAIWMLGANFEKVEYPNAGEIDIMEHVGKVPGEIHSTVHYPWNNHLGFKSSGKDIKIKDPSENYHVYSVNWTKDHLEFFVDHQSFYTFNLAETDAENNPFNQPFYLILNLALGGTWPGEIDEAIFPQKFLIDYVRVYKRAED